MSDGKYRGYLINPSGVMIKPRGKAHRNTLLNQAGGWQTDPETGELVNRGGFRIASEEEIAQNLAKWAVQSKRMQQQDLQAKKNNAQIVMMAPDPGTLDRLIDQREERRRADRASDEAIETPERKQRKKKTDTPES